MGKGIYTRGFLPHWDFDKSTQAITFRLADSVPAELIKQWNQELDSVLDSDVREKELHRRIAKYEDAGNGCAVFKNPSCAVIIQNKLLEGHSSRYSLIDWCIMPNHVHVLVRLMENQTLAEIIKSWKGGSAIEINRILQRQGTLWQRDYYDRYVRDMDHLYNCIAYIRNNPVKAGLCTKPEDWPFSSAGVNWNGAPASAGPKPQPPTQAG
ncbi:transposase [bacterium]|nr:transposase [bacterium]